MNSLLQALLKRATTPLVPQVGEAGDAASEAMTTPSLETSPTMAKLKGFGAGAVSGAGHLISDMTTPLSLTGLMTSGGVGSKLLSMAGNSAMGQLGDMATGVKPNLPAELVAPGEELSYNAVRPALKHLADPAEAAYLRILVRGGR